MMACPNRSFKIPNNSKFTTMLIQYWNNLMNNHTNRTFFGLLSTDKCPTSKIKRKCSLINDQLNGELECEREKATKKIARQIWSYAQSVNGCQSRICTRNGYLVVGRSSIFNIYYYGNYQWNVRYYTTCTMHNAQHVHNYILQFIYHMCLEIFPYQICVIFCV